MTQIKRHETLTPQQQDHASRQVGTKVLLHESDRIWRVGPPALGVEGADFMAIPADDPLGAEPRTKSDIRLILSPPEPNFSGTYEGKLAAAAAMEKAFVFLGEDHLDADEATRYDAGRILTECIYQLRRYVPVERYKQGERGPMSKDRTT